MTDKRQGYKTISSARWVYFLTRMEPKNKDVLPLYRHLTQQLHQYFDSEQDRLELECALTIYVYSIRDKSIRSKED